MINKIVNEVLTNPFFRRQRDMALSQTIKNQNLRTFPAEANIEGGKVQFYHTILHDGPRSTVVRWREDRTTDHLRPHFL